jgi:phage terminase large subunit
MTQYRYSAAVPFMRPSVFARDVLGMNLYPKQVEVADALTDPNSKISFMCCNNGGKTSRLFVTWILWHLTMWPKGKVKSTSGSWNQIIDQLQNALRHYKEIFDDNLEFQQTLIRSEEGGFWRGFSTNDPGKAEGDHADGPERPLLFLVDEAKTVPDPIFQAIDRCIGTDSPIRLVYASSPGYAEGMFFLSQTLMSKQFKCFKQTAEETPHITPKQIKDLKERWSGFPAFAESMLGHDFMPMVEDAVISMKALDYCLANPPKWVQGITRAFCDFAWSTDGDENVLAVNNGNKASLEDCFNCDNLQGICDRFISNFTRLSLKPEQISGDEGGGGKMIMDRLDELGWSLTRVNNGSAAEDSDHYVNCAAQTWYEASKVITAATHILPNDIELRGQLLSRKRTKGSQGRLNVESKRDMKARGVPSPDRAEAILNVIAPTGGFVSGQVARLLPMGVGNYTPCGF